MGCGVDSERELPAGAVPEEADSERRHQSGSQENQEDPRETLELLEQIIGASACGIFAYTLPDRKILQVNREAMRLTGWTQGDVRPGAQADRTPPTEDMAEEDRERISALARTLEKPGDSFSAAYRLQKEGKVYAVVDVQSKRLRTPGGQDMILITLVDVTEKARMEEKMHESLQAFHIASEEAGNVIVVYDTAARTIRFECREVPPYADGPLVEGVPYKTVDNGTVAEESREEYIRIHEAMLRGEKAAEGIVKRIARDGRERVCRLRFQTIRDGSGAPTGKAVGIYVDITKEHFHNAKQSFRIEAMRNQYTAIRLTAKQERSRYQEIVRALSDDYFAIYLVDLARNSMQTIRAQDKLLPQVAQLIGQEHPFDAAMDEYVRDYVHPDDRERVAAAMRLENLRERLKQERMVFMRYRRLAGEVCEYTEFKLVDVSDKQDASRSVLAVRSVDSEVRREIEQQNALKEALAQARYASQAKTVFLSNMSHDIRTPMNAIVGYSNIAAGHMDDKERVRDCVAKILSASSHLQSLINDILDMSRIESGKLNLREGPCSLPEVLRSLMSVIQSQLMAKRLNFSSRAMDIQSETVITDALKLRQVLINILGNAVKFTPAGGRVRFVLRQSRSMKPGYGRYSFIISDTGIGMSPEFREHIFEPFERETTSTLSQTEGTGLGMSITKGIVDAMGGTISVESEPGRGSTFKVELDLKLGTPPDLSDAVRLLSSRRALVVSSKAMGGDGVELLRRIGLRVELAANSWEATELIREAVREGDRYGVYLIDRSLPDLSGVELARRVREDAIGEPPIVVLADYDWSDVEGVDLGVEGVGFCGKPLFLSSVAEAMLQSARPLPEGRTLPELDCSRFVGRRILLVEDNEFNREIAVAILTEQGFQVETAVDGADALIKLEASRESWFDLILMDIQMPVMNGYDAARAIRALDRADLARLPIIAMTANAFEEDREAALKSGMNDHLSKPIDIDQMLVKISRVLRIEQGAG